MLVVTVLAVGNYSYDSVYGTGNNWTGYGRLQLENNYTFQSGNLLTFWIVNYGPGTVTLTNLYIANAYGTGSVASYPISMTIDPNAVGMLAENTTSQGVQLTQSSTYTIRLITSRNVQTTFTITWT